MAPTPEQNLGMHDSLHLRANELLTSLAALPGAESQIAALSLGVIGELELHGATLLIEHGQLEDAERLVAAWRGRGGKTGAEAALRRAIETGSVPAVAALAQHLQREQRLPEAIAQ